MKQRAIYNILIMCILLITGACTDEYDAEGNLVPSLSAHFLNPSKVNFRNNTSSAFSETFKVECYEATWKFSDVSNWFTLTPMSGNATASITLNVEENNDANNARTAIFYLQSTVSDWDFNRALSVSQEKAIASLSVNTNSITFGGATESQTVGITANCSWVASCSDSWVNLSSDVNSGLLKVTVDANPQSAYRSSNIYVSYGNNESIIIKVSQAPSEISVSDYTVEFENVASKSNITIKSEAAWTSAVSDSWITVNPEKGDAGQTNVAIEVTPNTSISNRTGHVMIKTGNADRIQITVVQKGIYVETEESTLTFGSLIESQKLAIRSNTSWTVVSKPNWISLSKETGEGNDNITVTTSDNPNTSARTGEIVIGQPGLSIQAKVQIVQNGKSLSTDTSLLEFSDKAGQQKFNLISDVQWKSSNSADWFASSPSSGEGNATISVSVTENTSVDERTGTIHYLYSDKSTYVNVHQQAKYLTIDNQMFEFGSKGGSHTIEVCTNDSWTAEIEHNVSWLKLSKYSGSGNAVITLTAEDNPSVNTRSTTIIITSKYAQSIKILVSQKPRHLSVSTQSILFFANGGTSDVVSIDTDGAYDIKNEGSWFTVNKGTNNTFTVYATKNTTNDIRSGKITISLTDLQEGSLSLELSVMQSGEGGTFIINGYTEDSDWDNVGNGSITVTFTGYTTDNNWNDTPGGTIKVNVTGYTTEHDWNVNDKSSGNVSINPYGTDVNWNDAP